MSSTRNWEVIKAYEDIHFEFFEGIARITIDRQEVYNAFRPETNMEMLDAMETVSYTHLTLPTKRIV